jgi:hypothetical protein
VIRRYLGFSISLLALACSESPPAIDPSDSGVSVSIEDAMVAPLPCSARAPAISLSEGSRASAVLELDRASASVELASVPQDWIVELESPDLRIRVPYGISGRFMIELSLACGAERGSATISVDVRRIVSRKLNAPNGPDAREHALLWIDGDRLFLFGGFSFVPQQFTVVWDLWSLELVSNVWTSLTPTGDVPHVASGRIAVGPDAVFHFGGSDQQNNILGAIHRIDHESLEFTKVSTASPASGTILGAFIYDAPRDRYLSVCGYTGVEINCDVRAFYPATGRWEDVAVAPGDAPTGRYGFFSAHDTETDRLIIFSGAQYPSVIDPVNAADDTWALELAEDPPRWTQIAGAEGDPRGRRNGCAAFDPVGHRLFILGGTPDARTTEEGLWALSLERETEAWTRVEVDGLMPVRSSGSGVYDAARARILFGLGNSSAAIYDDLWALEL